MRPPPGSQWSDTAPNCATGQAQPLIALVLTPHPHNREQLGRDRLDLVLLHNPERAHPGDRPALHRAILDVLRRPGRSRCGRARARVPHRHLGGLGRRGIHGGQGKGRHSPRRYLSGAAHRLVAVTHRS